MHLSKLGTIVAILATAAGFSALAGSAEAQISGSIGGDFVDNQHLPVPGGPRLTLTDGNVAFQWGGGEPSYDELGNLLGTTVSWSVF